jgi:hypothetical protein
MFLVLDDDRDVDTVGIADALEAVRDDPPAVMDTGVSASVSEAIGGLGLWLVLRDPDAGQMTSLGGATAATSMPAFGVDRGFMHTIVLVGETGLAALVRLDDNSPGSGTFRVGVLPIGLAGHGDSVLAQRLAAHVRDWDRAGRPRSSSLRISAFPSTSSPLSSLSPPPAAGGGSPGNHFVITKPQSRFVIDW